MVLVATVNCMGVPPWHGPTRMGHIGRWLHDALRNRRVDHDVVVVLQEVFLETDRQALQAALPDLHLTKILNWSRAATDRFQPDVLPPFVRRGGPAISGGVVVGCTGTLGSCSSIVFRDCCQFDCLSYKGAALVQCTLPSGRTVDVLGTHLQSWQLPCGAVRDRQLAEIRALVRARARPGVPVIFAGDWNEPDQGVLAAGLACPGRPVLPCPYEGETYGGMGIDHILYGPDGDVPQVGRAEVVPIPAPAFSDHRAVFAIL